MNNFTNPRFTSPCSINFSLQSFIINFSLFWSKRNMAASSTTKDKSITKISAFTAPKGKLGQKYLASGKTLSMRIWENEKAGEKESTAREYGINFHPLENNVTNFLQKKQ